MKEFIATIHFIGLALLSVEVPDHPGLHVLLPRVESHAGHLAPEVVDEKPTPKEPAIEAHVAFIIYDGKDFIDETGWTSEPIPSHMIRPSDEKGGPQYRFVRLNGEQVTFRVSGENPTVENLEKLVLPRPRCVERIAAGDRAATVRVSGGALNSCVARFGSETRYDSQIRLNNNGGIVVKAETDTETKKLFLSGNATIYVANVPSRMMETTEGPPAGDAQHFLAYYTLVTPDPPCTARELVIPDATAVDACPIEPLLLTGDTPIQTAELRGITITNIIDSNCSNSAWP